MGKKRCTKARTTKSKLSRKRRTRIRTRVRTRLKGGMVQTDTSKTSWKAVLDMIRKGTSLELISAQSLSGFIFRLDIDPTEPRSNEFVGLNKERDAFTQPVYSIVLKFVFLGETRRNITFQVENEKGEKRDLTKVIEKAGNLRLEADHQQMIYQETILPQGRPVTLAVVDVSKFDAANARTLIAELENVLPTSEMVPVMLNSLKTNVNENVHLGLISMELANPTFETLRVARRRLRPPVYDDACAYALAQVALLFVKLKVVLFDCHEENVLVNTAIETNPDEDKSTLIDFGKMFNIKDVFRLFESKKEQIIAEFEQMSKKYQRFTGRLTGSCKETLLYIRSIRERFINENALLDVLHNLAFLDCAISLPRMVKPSPAEAPVRIKRPQMLALIRYLYPKLEKGEQDWLTNPPLLENMDLERAQHVLSIFRQMVESSPAKEVSLLHAKGQLYHVPDSIPNQTVTPILSSPLPTETPQSKTPPTDVGTTPQEETQPYSPVKTPPIKRIKIDREFEDEADA